MINIVEILKNYPKGTKLYSPICGECRLIKIYDGLGFDVINDTDAVFNFLYDGRYHLNGECCIFPSKEDRDWNTFHPWTIQDAKDGDVIFYDDGWTCIFKCIHGIWYSSYCFLTSDGNFHTGYERHAVDSTINGNAHPATKEQCNLLFQKMKEAGYKWNAETKTLEKILVPKFKAGDKIKEKNERFPSTRTIGNYTEGIGYFTTINDWVRIEDQDNWELVPTHKFKAGDKIVKKDNPTEYWYVQGIDIYDNSFYFIVANGKLAKLPLNDQDKWELAPVPKFKVGDIVETKRNKLFDYKIIKITDTHYTLESIPGANTYDILICEDENWKLVPKKFDISTLKAYDKVLVRDTNEQVWVADLFSHVLDRPLGGYTFACIGHYPNQCIPYEGNEHLLGTNNDCDEYYKNWKTK